ncbi:TPA: MucR family transcriptional regulator [Salmonella enterica]|nr:MucR family transcriptional regulator [Salmonella enterica]
MKPIKNKQDVADYLSGDKIQCLECGKIFQMLGTHLLKAHGMTSAEYREKFNLPAETPLAGIAYRQVQRDKMNRLIKEGVVTHWHLADAVEKARTAGRGKRQDFDLSEQKERMKRNAHYQDRTLPPGSKRADGRDADRFREYQRASRAQKKGDNALMIKYLEKYPKGTPW